MSSSKIIGLIADQLSIPSKSIEKVSDLLEEGATIPFIARYRKEVTGSLDEVQLRDIRDKLDYYTLLEQRRETILESIKKQEKLTPELEKAILGATDLTTLEDLYLPYKPKRKTRASVAIERGLEPLADLIWEQKTTKGDAIELAGAFINPDLEVPDAESALNGARDIVAEKISQHPEVRDMLRYQFRNFSSLVANKTEDDKDEARTYETYYKFNQKVKFIKPYQVLAIDRAEREGVLSVKLDVWEDRVLDEIDSIIIENDDSIFVTYLEEAVEDAWKRLLNPSISREIRGELTEKAGEHAISMFAENVKNLLLQPPFSTKTIMGIDPAYRTGCKVAIIDQHGNYLEGTTIYPTPPHNKVEESKIILSRMVATHKVELIAIGNGTGSRETESIVADLIGELKGKDPNLELAYLVTSEAGASVYSASDIAREEFPDLDAAQRGNISIARRVQDPLAELVKIDPKSIGVGLYQHDVNQVSLMRSLGDVVESCVNHVGVNINTASAPLLSYVSGLSKVVAGHIVNYRSDLGGFSSREQLQDVPGVGPFRFQQAAGFLRIPESKNPLDNTAIHPESYDAALKLCSELGIDIHSLGSRKEEITQKLKTLNIKTMAAKLGIGEPTLELIVENLLKPGRDPREDLPKPVLRQDVLKMEELNTGMKLTGTVRNVVDFGAFVDVGVKADGLIHVSQLRTDGKRVDNVMDEVAVGDIVEVEVISVDIQRQRIALKRV